LLVSQIVTPMSSSLFDFVLPDKVCEKDIVGISNVNNKSSFLILVF